VVVKDHNYVREDGTKVPVSQMTDEEIHMCLQGGIGIQRAEIDNPIHWVRLRLEIELLIRKENMR
jgi:hypothetical protein